MEIAIIYIALCAGVGALASSRDRSFFGFLLLSVITSPIVGLIVVLVMKNLRDEADKKAKEDAVKAEEVEKSRKDHEAHLASIQAISSRNSSPISIADELTKLSLLKDKGVLTEDEFNTQKAAMLSKG